MKAGPPITRDEDEERTREEKRGEERRRWERRQEEVMGPGRPEIRTFIPSKVPVSHP